MSWRSEAALIIGQVIRQVGRQDMTALRKKLAEAYPWGARENYPYKVWLAEIRHQLGVAACNRKQQCSHSAPFSAQINCD